jgi:hypothetical protein
MFADFRSTPFSSEIEENGLTLCSRAPLGGTYSVTGAAVNPEMDQLLPYIEDGALPRRLDCHRSVAGRSTIKSWADNRRIT